ncbi:MAG: 6-phospho-beta-galactosidase [Chlamydiia bacterium]|nr:6-phospho-beta-galactosidase [Chlamydiia bacterium]
MSAAFSISQVLKTPTHMCAKEVLGECLISGGELKSSKFETLAMCTLHALGLFFTMPLWVIGEAVEVFSTEGGAVFTDQVNLGEFDRDEVALDRDKTEYVGTAVSTFQATSNPQFCAGSAMHTAHSDPNLGLGQGVDILTLEGRNLHIHCLKEMNANSFRFSVEWADVNANGLDAYVQAAKHFSEHGFTLFITLDHWIGDGNPHLLEEEGDIANFVSYAEDVYHALRPYASCFLTFNEPTVEATGKYVRGVFPPHTTGDFWSARKLISLKLKAHREAHQALHLLEQTYTGAKAEGRLLVGLTHSAVRFESNSRWNIPARIIAFVMTYIFHESFLIDAERSRNSIDVLGVQFYARPQLGSDGSSAIDSIAEPNRYNPNGWMIEGMRYRFDPQGVLPILEEVWNRVCKPLIVSEIGCAGELFDHAPADENSDEHKKAVYYQVAIRAMRVAQDLGIPLIGAFFWTLFANLEWEHGYKPETNFAVLANDPHTKRIRRTEGYSVLSKAFQSSVYPKVTV